ncbi:hypothetical protein C0580_04460 [Candidatus Parcubacteria bacterium]|nr:MAG: hypothetical protein C0580_04460 [Candidatus Parcubacteria bacterium]
MSGYGCVWDYPPDLYMLHNSDGPGFPEDPVLAAEVERLFQEHDDRLEKFSAQLVEITDKETPRK